MTLHLAPPYQSIADPLSSAEGSIDPLGSGAIYDRLANRIWPAITLRMSHMRYLTCMVAVSQVCFPQYEAETVAADGVTPAWLVLEWYVVEALVRAREELPGGNVLTIPGKTKVARSIQSGHSVSARSYLKTPTVFGFGGIHRRLAVGLELLDDQHQLREDGMRLLEAWETDQKLEGFRQGRHGAGADLRELLSEALQDGLRRGRTERPRDWEGWSRIVQHLRPDKLGPRERKCLLAQLLRTDFLVDPGTQQALEMRCEMLNQLQKHGSSSVPADERKLFAQIESSCTPQLKLRLSAIGAFEEFCCATQDAFGLLLHLSASRGAEFIPAALFCEHPLAVKLPPKIAAAIQRIREHAELLAWEPSLSESLDRYEDVDSPRDLLAVLVAHHEHVQREKPPDGKRPWLVQSGDKFCARIGYGSESAPDGRPRFVHDYRTDTVSRFLRQLKAGPK